MIHTLKNKYLSVVASTHGAELQSVLGCDGTQYLWQGAPDIWPQRAPNLFPYVARLTNGQYSLDGQRYTLPIHGFASASTFACEQTSGSALTFTLTASDATRTVYPYEFVFSIIYQLDENRLRYVYRVQNKDTRAMFFGLGAHPGFNVPLEAGLSFDDYQLTFPSPSRPVRVGFTPQCFVDASGIDVAFPLVDEVHLPLAHSLFDNDAIVLRGAPHQVTLYSPKGGRRVSVSYPDMPYLGLWHHAGAEVPYICIEPWSSLPSRQGVVEDLEKQSDLIHLPAGATYETILVFEFS